MTKISQDIQDKAIALVFKEKTAWEDATAYITPKVAFNMRTLVETLRKNYYGIFDKPKDPQTGLNKIWMPFTERAVEDTVKNYDIDQKDMNFRAKNTEAIPTTQIVRGIVQDRLDKMFFGEKLDRMERSLAIDGTVVWKTWEGKDKHGKKVLKTEQIDLLNIFIDPTAKSIQDTESMIERAIMNKKEISMQEGWTNTGDISWEKNLQENNTANSGHNEVDKIEVYERWGLMPKCFITGNTEDDELIEGQIVVSGIDAESAVLHVIRKNTKGWKPYEEAWYTRVPGRWYGRGPAEKVMFLQIWGNTVKNIHINRQRVSQLGLFKIKKNSGITPQMLSRLPVNGAIKVNSMDDIEQMVMQEASSASYRDMDDIDSWTKSITSAFEAVTGESLPSSMPATNAVLQDRNAKSAFKMVQEGIGMFLQRWMDRHALPIIIKTTSSKEIIRVISDDAKIGDFLDRVIALEALKTLEEVEARGEGVPSEADLSQSMEVATQSLKKRGDVFVELKDIIIPNNYETKFYVTAEEMDIALNVSNLINMMNIAPEYRDSMVRQAFDLMGMDIPQKAEVQQQPGQAKELQVPETLQSLTTNANVPA